MNIMSRLNFMLVCAVRFRGARAFAAETDSVSPPPSADAATQAVVNGYLQIQEQLHATLLAIENNRQQAEAEAATNAAALTARIQALEQTIADQRASEIEAARKTQQLALFMAGAFGLIGLGIMLLMVYFQWRVFTQLIKITTRQPSAFALGNNRALPLVEAANELAAPGRAAVESSNARLLGAVERLEKRDFGIGTNRARAAGRTSRAVLRQQKWGAAGCGRSRRMRRQPDHRGPVAVERQRTTKGAGMF